MAITAPLSPIVKAAAKVAVGGDGFVLAKLTPNTPPAADTGASLTASHVEAPKDRTAGHVLLELLGQQAALRKARADIRKSPASDDAKFVEQALSDDAPALNSRKALLRSELKTQLQAHAQTRGTTLSDAQAETFATNIMHNIDTMGGNDYSLFDVKQAYTDLVSKSNSFGEVMPDWFLGKDKGGPDVEEYEKKLKERTKTLADIREAMAKATDGKGTFSGLLSGLAPALEGPPAKVKADDVRTAVTRFMKKRGHSDEQAFAMALVCEEGSKTNIALQGVTALMYGGKAIPQSIMAAINAGTKIDVTSTDLGTAGEALTGDVSQIMKDTYTEVSVAQRDQQCMQLWRVLADPDSAGKQHLSMKTPLTAAQMENMPASIRARFGDKPTMGDMMTIVKEGGFSKYATALTGAYAHATKQDDMRRHPFNRNEIRDTVRGALGMPPDGSTIIASMDQYVAGGGRPAAHFDHGQHNPNIKMSALGFPRDVSQKSELLPPAKRLAPNEPALAAGKGFGQFFG